MAVRFRILGEKQKITTNGGFSMRERVLQNIVALSALLGIASQPALADPKGTFRAGSCNRASSIFLSAQGAASNHQIGRTNQVGSVVNSGNGVTGLEVLVNYGASSVAFQSLNIQFADDGKVRKNVNVHFCFRDARGRLISRDKKLSQAGGIAPFGDGWYQAVFQAQDLGFNSNTAGNILVKFTVDLDNSHGSITFGKTSIGAGLRNFGVDNINLNLTDCSILDNCDDAPSAD
jgi:hypothetical protein